MIWRIVLTMVAASVGGCVGWLGGAIGNIRGRSANDPFLAQEVPLPHHVPKYPGGVSFRFAMAHDVIHERFAKHGPAHYRERDRITRETLQKLAPDDPARFALADDLGVGLDRLGRSDEAAALMREKLVRQQSKGLFGRDLYTSYADLGTFLIHGNVKQAGAGDPSARDRFREGLEYIHKSVEVNPEAHFGREQWQAAIAEFLLAAIDDPALLTTFDCLGNRLDLGIEEIRSPDGGWTVMNYGHPFDPAFRNERLVDVPAFVKPGLAVDDPSRWTEVSPIRRAITKVGAESGWEKVAVPSHRSPGPFDEPMLGIIGMWRQGGGANPHFALALGETMLRVGERRIAWSAYERAFRLADRYSTSPAARDFLRAHCRKRQAQIERTLSSEPGEIDRLLPQFDAELAYGEGFQKDYQDFEAGRIAAGSSINDEHFFDTFPRRNEAIASKSGPEESIARVPNGVLFAYQVDRSNAWAVFGAGLAAITTAGLLHALRKTKIAEVKYID